MADTPINNGVQTFKVPPVLSKKIIYFLQPTWLPIGSPATMPAWTTEGDTDYAGDSIDEQTKQGRLIMASTNEDSIELTQYMAPKDPSVGYIKKAKHEGKQVKVWRVVLDDATAEDEGEDTKAYLAEFGYGIVDELELDDSDDLVEANYTLNILDKLKDGTFPLSSKDLAMLEQIYEYERPGETTGDFGAQDTAEAGTDETPKQ
jgi:TP901-1 family phage major tail protein